MNSEENIVFELLRNEHFIQWVRNPTDGSDRYWTKWIAGHAGRKKAAAVARGIIRSGNLKFDRSISAEQYNTLQENILVYARQRKGHVVATRFRSGVWKYVAVAASITLAILSYAYLMNGVKELAAPLTKAEDIVKEAPYGTKLTTRLPDGTIVTLNSGTTLSFPAKFEGTSREVTLSGEAFFEVEHDAEKPFFVHFRNEKVKVVGTSFNIRCYEDETLAAVAVATGKVSYSISEGDRVMLTPDEMASHIKGEDKLVSGVVNRLAAFGWKDRILYFQSNSFDEIAIALERWFGVEIKTSQDFSPAGTYSGEFDNASLKEVLSGLSFIYRFDYSIEGSNVHITKSVK